MPTENEIYDKTMTEEQFSEELEKKFAEAVTSEEPEEDSEDAEKSENAQETEEEADDEEDESDSDAVENDEDDDEEPSVEEEIPSEEEKSPPEKTNVQKKPSKLERMHADLEELAKSQMYDSVEEMIAEMKGISVEEYKKTLEDDGRDDYGFTPEARESIVRIGEQDAPLWAANDAHAPKSVFDLKDPVRYMKLRAAEMSAVAAYNEVQGISPKKAVSSKTHLKGSAPARKVGGGTTIPAKDLRAMKELFPNMKESEIADLYRRTNQ